MKWGKGQGARVLVSMLLTLGSVVGIAPAAYAHGEHGAALAALEEPAGPYVVSVWVEVFADRSITTSAVIESDLVGEAPEVWLQTAQGRRTIDDLADKGGGTWTVQFQSAVGDTLVVGWSSPQGPEQIMVALEEMPAPWWFRVLLAAVAPPGVWFGYWLLKRFRRTFGVAATPAYRVS